MRRTTRSLLFALATASLFVGAGCAATPDAPLATVQPLVVDAPSSAQDFRAHVVLDDETIVLESTLTATTRVTTVRGSDGESYAEWNEVLANSETTGTLGGLAFGTDPTTDGDTARWNGVLEGRTGAVLRAVALAASGELARRAAAQDATYTDALTTFEDMPGFLGEMAGVTVDLGTTGAGTSSDVEAIRCSVHASASGQINGGGVMWTTSVWSNCTYRRVWIDAADHSDRSTCNWSGSYGACTSAAEWATFGCVNWKYWVRGGSPRWLYACPRL